MRVILENITDGELSGKKRRGNGSHPPLPAAGHKRFAAPATGACLGYPAAARKGITRASSASGASSAM